MCAEVLHWKELFIMDAGDGGTEWRRVGSLKPADVEQWRSALEEYRDSGGCSGLFIATAEQAQDWTARLEAVEGEGVDYRYNREQIFNELPWLGPEPGDVDWTGFISATVGHYGIKSKL